jgi:hypothetical protein
LDARIDKLGAQATGEQCPRNPPTPCTPNASSENGNGGNGGESASDLTPLMQLLQCYAPCTYSLFEEHNIKAYGWIQQGLTFNFDGPSDRTNFGTSFNLRSNDYRLNQVYLVLEKTLGENKQEYSWGFRWDFFAGHDAPFLANISLGLFDDFTGGSFNSVGIEMPQFYAEAHLPILTTNGVDIRIGRFYTFNGYEPTPAALTDFYSHAYGFFFGPFTHTGITFTVYLGDTLQLMNGIVRGWDVVFEDNNDSPSWHGSLKYTSCDQRTIAYISWMVGPELPNNNHDLRTYITYDLIRKFGTYDQWKIGLNFGTAWESHAAPGGGTARWQEGAVYLFYTIDPRLILGFRAEIYNDEDGVRTGFADRFHEITLGLTYKPYKNLRIRPEIRFDWSDKTRPFNDLQEKSQQTAAIDIIWEF